MKSDEVAIIMCDDERFRQVAVDFIRLILGIEGEPTVIFSTGGGRALVEPSLCAGVLEQLASIANLQRVVVINHLNGCTGYQTLGKKFANYLKEFYQNRYDVRRAAEIIRESILLEGLRVIPCLIAIGVDDEPFEFTYNIQ